MKQLRLEQKNSGHIIQLNRSIVTLLLGATMLFLSCKNDVKKSAGLKAPSNYRISLPMTLKQPILIRGKCVIG